MNFRPEHPADDLEINLVPLIDVLLVILIFLAATTTFTRFTQLEITLPEARTDVAQTRLINITVSRDGIYALNDRLLSGNTTQDIAQALKAAVREHHEFTMIITADARASHESVVRVMEAARLAGIEKINFATQSPH